MPSLFCLAKVVSWYWDQRPSVLVFCFVFLIPQKENPDLLRNVANVNPFYFCHLLLSVQNLRLKHKIGLKRREYSVQNPG